MKSVEQRTAVRFILPLALIVISLAIYRTTPTELFGVSGQALESAGYAIYTGAALFFVAVLNHARNPLMRQHTYDSLRKALSSYGGTLVFLQVHGILPDSTLLLSTGVVFIVGTMAGIWTDSLGVTIDDFPDKHQLYLRFE